MCIESYFAETFDPPEQRFVESCAALAGRCMEKEARAAAKDAEKSR